VTVPHQAISAIRKLQLLHRGEECLRFQLDSLRKKLPRTRSQDIGQWILNLVGLTQRDNVAILVHGVSLSSNPPRYAAYLTPSSPSFPHNSRTGRDGGMHPVFRKERGRRVLLALIEAGF